MTCSEFDQAFDPYVDGVLDPVSAAAARMHVDSCPICDRTVARWQQSRILLSTAVAEIATAVDVSGLLAAVSSALDDSGEVGVAPPRRRLVSRRAHREHELHAQRGASSVRAEATAGASRRASKSGRFSGLRHFATVAGAAAAAAAASILLLAPGPSPLVEVATKAATSSGSFASSWVKPVAFNTEAPSSGAGWRPLSPVPALVDAIEPGAGHTVSTWVQPRTQARVIWVQRQDSGPTVQTAGYQK